MYNVNSQILASHKGTEGGKPVLPRLYRLLLAFHYFSSPFLRGKHLKRTHHADSKISATS